jgi:hypothetical protein
MAESSAQEPRVDTAARVETTGIALVHEGEYIVADAGSAARISASPQASDLPPPRFDADGEVHYWFPVVIEVVGSLGEQAAAEIVARVYDELQREFASRQ